MHSVQLTIALEANVKLNKRNETKRTAIARNTTWNDNKRNRIECNKREASYQLSAPTQAHRQFLHMYSISHQIQWHTVCSNIVLNIVSHFKDISKSKTNIIWTKIAFTIFWLWNLEFGIHKQFAIWDQIHSINFVHIFAVREFFRFAFNYTYILHIYVHELHCART